MLIVFSPSDYVPYVHFLIIKNIEFQFVLFHFFVFIFFLVLFIYIFIFGSDTELPICHSLIITPIVLLN